jgi:hypothetical protein
MMRATFVIPSRADGEAKPLTPGLQAGVSCGKDGSRFNGFLRDYSLIDKPAAARRRKPLKRLSSLSVVRHRPEGRC